jgi:hypothetical protein
VEVYVFHHLVGKLAVVLQYVVVLRSSGDRDLLTHRQHLTQVVVRDVSDCAAVVFGNDKLKKCEQSVVEVEEIMSHSVASG